MEDVVLVQEPITRSVHLVLYVYDGVSLFCAIFKFLYIVEDVLLLATVSGGAFAPAKFNRKDGRSW